jgi:hypothetical protein
MPATNSAKTTVELPPEPPSLNPRAAATVLAILLEAIRRNVERQVTGVRTEVPGDPAAA